MNARVRFPIVLAVAAVLLAFSLGLWLAAPGGLHAGRPVDAALSPLTLGQNAAIQTTNLLLLNESRIYQTYLPAIKR
jgi:hypothetical protein